MHLPSSLGLVFVSEALSMIFMNNPQIYSSKDFLYPQIFITDVNLKLLTCKQKNFARLEVIQV